MKRLRTHIARSIIVLLIWSGFSLSLVQPVQAEHATNAFADWLSTKATSTESAAIQQQLERLRQSTERLDKVIEKASQIVSQNNDEFAFSYDKTMASQQLYQMLLIEWNQFQTGDAMAAVPVQQTAKSLVPVKIDNLPLGLIGNTSVDYDSHLVKQVKQIFPFQLVISAALVPMSGGIAIGAP